MYYLSHSLLIISFINLINHSLQTPQLIPIGAIFTADDHESKEAFILGINFSFSYLSNFLIIIMYFYHDIMIMIMMFYHIIFLAINLFNERYNERNITKFKLEPIVDLIHRSEPFAFTQKCK